MSAPKFTAGPWVAKDVQPDAWTRQVWTDEGHGSVMIATTGGIHKEANARIIAAAPDLYAALREAHALFESCLDGRPHIVALQAKILAAIAKAEGGTV